MTNKEIPIFFTINEDYAPYLGVAIHSLIENASKDYNYNIHIIHEELKPDTYIKLKSLEGSNVRIIFSEMAHDLSDITKRKENYLRKDLFTLTIYYRLFLPMMFSEYDKAIYIDSDVVIPGDISEFFAIDLEDNLFGGCNDISVKNNDILGNYFEKNAGISRDKYINSGVLLMNMKKLREIKFHEIFLNMLLEYHFDTICPDQDYINVIAKNKIKLIPNEWNTMPTCEGLLVKNPKLIHYNLFYKPWHYDNIDYEEYFWEYADKSVFKDRLHEIKDNYSAKDVEKDKIGFQELINRADKIANSNYTFKSILK